MKVVEEQLKPANKGKDACQAIKSNVEGAKVKAEELGAIFEKIMCSERRCFQIRSIRRGVAHPRQRAQGRDLDQGTKYQHRTR